MLQSLAEAEKETGNKLKMNPDQLAKIVPEA